MDLNIIEKEKSPSDELTDKESNMSDYNSKDSSKRKKIVLI